MLRLIGLILSLSIFLVTAQAQAGQSHPEGADYLMSCTQKNFYGSYPDGGNCNYYGCYPSGGGCNYYGCWLNGGGCNYYGCWQESGSCNYYGCVRKMGPIKCGQEQARPTPSRIQVHAPFSDSQTVRMRCTESNAFGSYPHGGGCNAFGCFPAGGGCNAFGCHPREGSCNAFGCTASGKCTAFGCPSEIKLMRCLTAQELHDEF